MARSRCIIYCHEALGDLVDNLETQLPLPPPRDSLLNVVDPKGQENGVSWQTRWKKLEAEKLLDLANYVLGASVIGQAIKGSNTASELYILIGGLGVGVILYLVAWLNIRSLS